MQHSNVHVDIHSNNRGFIIFSSMKKMIKIINTIKNKLKQYDEDRCDHIILNVIFNILKIYVNVIFFIFFIFLMQFCNNYLNLNS